MSKKRWIDTKFWSDPWIVDYLDREERYLFLYLISNDKTNIAGVYEISLRTIANEADFSKEQVLTMLEKMSSRVAYIDGWIVMKNTIKNQNYKNSKIMQGINLILQACPAEVLEHVKYPSDWEGYRYVIDESSIAHGSISDSDSDSDSDSEANAIGAKNAPKRKSTKRPDGPIAKLYYEAIRSLSLPVRNHNTLWEKIKALEHEGDQADVMAYLTFMRDDFKTFRMQRKPHINEALDIYAKRVQLQNLIELEQKENSQYD